MKNKTVAGLLAFFLGGLGIHKFYLGRGGWGIVYLLFCWTFIPTIISLIEAILFFTMSEDAFNAKYNLATMAAQHLAARPQPVEVNIRTEPPVSRQKNAEMAQNEWTKFTTTVAGYQYHDAPKVTHLFVPGTRLQLSREYDNQYDDNAVKIMLDNYFIGYIPREQAEMVADAIEQGDNVIGIIKRFDPYRDDFMKLNIEVRRNA